ncbi:hypothetical protein [Pseudomonas sp. PSKL.D1]|uniref:hypothetical protein n=1 Tax=Pseudomonas sp. PSKL.D1 TaxID=3029060 RepID=UPI002380C752|nr:hypothetical protein [Pseudomonas sp. PSKL.D1]WDY57889.1 hypothetical protein PVV54_25550 [Pseudomonas sp. PSKL.D1]
MITLASGIVGIVIFGLGLVVVVITYVAICYVDRVEALLVNSKYIAILQEGFSRVGLPGKIIRTCCIAIMFFMPGPFIRKGLADGIEIARFPRRLKWLLVGLWVSLCILVLLILL